MVTLLLLFDCQTELHFQDPKRNRGDPSQICAKKVHTLHEWRCKYKINLKLSVNVSRKLLVSNLHMHQVDQPHGPTT
jgi:hypothetical protein